MKKLLSLLSILTISGAAVPTTIAASPYQKEETIKNSDINLQQTNNLEKLNRVKRTNTNKTKISISKNKNKNSTGMLESTINEQQHTAETSKINKSNAITNKNKFKDLNKTKKVSLNNIRNRIKNHCLFKGGSDGTSNNNRQYKNFLRESINYFQETENIKHETEHPVTNKKIFKLEKNNFNKDDIIAKIIPLKTIDEKDILIPHNSTQKFGKHELEVTVEQESRNRRRTVTRSQIDVVLNSSNLYLDGFITTNKNNKKTYWHFDGDDVGIKEIDGVESKTLGFSANYSSLVGNKSIQINKQDILSSIDKISNTTEENKNEIKDDLVRVIFMTSESMRFFSIREKVDNVLNNDESINWTDYKDTLNNWGQYSKKYYDMKEKNIEFSNNEKEKIYDISILKAKEDN